MISEHGSSSTMSQGEHLRAKKVSDKRRWFVYLESSNMNLGTKISLIQY